MLDGCSGNSLAEHSLLPCQTTHCGNALDVCTQFGLHCTQYGCVEHLCRRYHSCHSQCCSLAPTPHPHPADTTPSGPRLRSLRQQWATLTAQAGSRTCPSSCLVSDTLKPCAVLPVMYCQRQQPARGSSLPVAAAAKATGDRSTVIPLRVDSTSKCMMPASAVQYLLLWQGVKTIGSC
jgi:hypothetical protein